MGPKVIGSVGAPEQPEILARIRQRSRWRRMQAIMEALASGQYPEATVSAILREITLLLRAPVPARLLHASPAGDVSPWDVPRPAPAQEVPAATLAAGALEALAVGDAYLASSLHELFAAATPPWLASWPTIEGLGGHLLLLPVSPGGQLAAAVLAFVPGPRPNRAQGELLHLLAGQLAIPLPRLEHPAAAPVTAEAVPPAAGEPALAASELEASLRHLEAICEAAVALAGEIDLQRVGQAVVTQAMAVLRPDAAALFVPAAVPGMFEVRAHQGLARSYAGRARITAVDAQAAATRTAGGPATFKAGARSPRWVRRLLSAGRAKAVAVHPLVHGQQLVGLLALLARSEEVLPQLASSRFTAIFGKLAAATVQGAALHREMEHGAAESTFLLQVSQLLSSTLDVTAVAGMLASEAADLLRCEVAALYTHDPLDASIGLQALVGTTRRRLLQAGLTRVRLDVLPANARLAAEGQPVAAEWPGKGDLLSLFGPACRLQSSLTIPLRARGALLGLLFLGRHVPRRFTAADVHLGIKLGALGALALDNTRLHADLMEQMRQLQVAQAQLIEAEKMIALGRIVAGVAHALNNPLAVISGYAQMLLDSGPPTAMRGDLEAIDRNARRAAEIVRELLAFARQQPMLPTTVRPADLLRGALQREETALREAGLETVLAIDEALPCVRGDRNQLERVMSQLLANARQAMLAQGQGTTVTLGASYRERVLLWVADDGPAIPADMLDSVFEPFLTARPGGPGLGLGLAMCYGVIRAHGGRVWAANNPEGGATFYVELPAVECE